MAVLKFRGSRGFGWVCDVRSVHTGVCWEVPESKWDRPGSCQPSTAFGKGLNVIDHGLPTDDDHVDSSPGKADGVETDPPGERTRLAVELAVTHNGPRVESAGIYEVHIVPAGEAWLMGDDGRTIDRIP